MRARLIVSALVLCLAATGCSDDGDGASSPTTAGQSGTSAPLNSRDAADLLEAEQIVLKQSDFPEGWLAIPDSGEDEQEEEDRAGEEFEACLGSLVDDDDRPKAESPEFERNQFSRVGSGVEFAPTVEDARKELAALQGPKLNECLQAQFDKELRTLGGDVEFGPIKVEPTPFPALGDGTVAARLSTAVAAADGNAVPLYNDFVFVLKGRAKMSLTFTNAGEPFPTDLAADLAGKMAARA